MYPELRLGDLMALSTYQTLGMAAAAVAIGITGFRFAGMGLPLRQTGFLLAIMALGFVAGARLFNWETNPFVYEGRPDLLAGIYWGNFSLLGGIAGGALAGAVTGKFLKRNIWKLADGAVYGVAPAIFLAKLGCFGNGCCFGVPTELPWGVTYPVGSTPSAYYMAKSIGSGNLLQIFGHTTGALHPTQLYEGIGALCCLVGASWLSRWFPAPGSRFLIFIGGFSAVRMMSWELRVPPPGWGMMPEFYPVLYGTLIILSATLLILKKYHAKGGEIHDTCSD